ncbi:MAG: low molecular weight phosphatase family protein [Thermoguttaceae bacterium]|jgi:protein-tyrosine phosphatase
MKTVLFLCSANYYRSRYAEHFFNWHAESNGLRWRAKSKGLAVGRWGNIGPISRYAIERLNEIGIPINGNSRFPQQVAEIDLSDASIVIALKKAEHREMLEESFPDWADQVEYWHIDDLDCADPEEALPVLENEVLGLLERLENGGCS